MLHRSHCILIPSTTSYFHCLQLVYIYISHNNHFYILKKKAIFLLKIQRLVKFVDFNDANHIYFVTIQKES